MNQENRKNVPEEASIFALISLGILRLSWNRCAIKIPWSEESYEFYKHIPKEVTQVSLGLLGYIALKKNSTTLRVRIAETTCPRELSANCSCRKPNSTTRKVFVTQCLIKPQATSQPRECDLLKIEIVGPATEAGVAGRAWRLRWYLVG